MRTPQCQLPVLLAACMLASAHGQLYLNNITDFLSKFTLKKAVSKINEFRGYQSTYKSILGDVYKTDGKYIHSFWNHGCLNAGCCSLFFSQLRSRRSCPSSRWTTWSFNGATLSVQKIPFKVCLEYRMRGEDLPVGTAPCSGRVEQQWHFDVLTNHTTMQGDALFTINPTAIDFMCLTLNPFTNVYELRECTNPLSWLQLFYVTRNWLDTAVSARRSG